MKLWSTSTWVTRLLLLHHCGGKKTHSRKSPTSCLQPPNSVPVVIVPDQRASYHVYTAKCESSTFCVCMGRFTVRFCLLCCKQINIHNWMLWNTGSVYKMQCASIPFWKKQTILFISLFSFISLFWVSCFLSRLINQHHLISQKHYCNQPRETNEELKVLE